MKKILPAIFSLALLASCSSDEVTSNNNVPSNNVQVSKIIWTSLTTNEVKLTYHIDDNKITSIDRPDGSLYQEFAYENNKLSTVNTYNSNGAISATQQFNYNSSNEISSIFNNEDGSTYTLSMSAVSDTLVVTRVDEMNTPLTTFKLVYDNNNNVTYYHLKDEVYNFESKVLSDYDTANNLLSEEYYQMNSSGEYFLSYANLYTHDASSINTFNAVFENTYGRKLLGFLYAIRSGGFTGVINNMEEKVMSPNNYASMTTSWGDNYLTFDLINTVNNDGYSDSFQYKCYAEGALYSDFKFDYFFE